LTLILIRPIKSGAFPTHFRKKCGNGWGTDAIFRGRINIDAYGMSMRRKREIIGKRRGKYLRSAFGPAAPLFSGGNGVKAGAAFCMLFCAVPAGLAAFLVPDLRASAPGNTDRFLRAPVKRGADTGCGKTRNSNLLIRPIKSGAFPTHFRKKRGNGWGTDAVFWGRINRCEKTGAKKPSRSG
jgi:hypothetical protein